MSFKLLVMTLISSLVLLSGCGGDREDESSNNSASSSNSTSSSSSASSSSTSSASSAGSTSSSASSTSAASTSSSASSASTSSSASSSSSSSSSSSTSSSSSSGAGEVVQGTVVWESDFEFEGPDWASNSWPGDRDSNNDGQAEFLRYLGDGAEELEFHTWDIVDKNDLTQWFNGEATVDISSVRGQSVYAGQIFGPFSKSHRAYPNVHFDQPGNGGNPDFADGVPSPFINQWWVWWDPKDELLDRSCWMHLATWSNNVDWQVHTLNVSARDDHYALSFYNGNKVKEVNEINPENNRVPVGQWFRVTVYIDYEKDNGGEDNDGLAVFWLNDELIATATGNNLSATATGNGTPYLKRAHWGLYAAQNCAAGFWVEDHNIIWTLDEPLSEFDVLPLPPPH